jgi:RNA polymerase sigma-70 factor, ECF subfamily
MTADADSVTDFEPHRSFLVGLAYRMLGSVAEAEDVIQDAFLRWREVDRSAIAEPRAYLARVVSRLCLDRMKSASHRRESYVGTWLPEPVIAQPAETLADDLSVALLLALERLSPLERAAFLLHDVFDMDYAAVGDAIDHSETACRQLAARARAHVRQDRPRYAANDSEARKLTEAFVVAAATGDVDVLSRVLADDAVLYSTAAASGAPRSIRSSARIGSCASTRASWPKAEARSPRSASRRRRSTACPASWFTRPRGPRPWLSTSPTAPSWGSTPCAIRTRSATCRNPVDETPPTRRRRRATELRVREHTRGSTRNFCRIVCAFPRDTVDDIPSRRPLDVARCNHQPDGDARNSAHRRARQPVGAGGAAGKLNPFVGCSQLPGDAERWTERGDVVSGARRIDCIGRRGRLGAAQASRKSATAAASGDIEPLLLAFDRLLAIEDPDAAVRRAIELARDRIGLVRVSAYVVDQCSHLMLGTWGSDASGAIVDEHHVMYAMSRLDRDIFRSDEAGAQYTVLEQGLVVEHRAGGTEVAGRGWITCTPIRCGHAVMGMMCNDAGLSRAAFEEAKQAQLAILCSVLGTALASLTGTHKRGNAGADHLPAHRLVMAAVAMLAQDPGVGVTHIARQLAISRQRLTRLFEGTLGVPLEQYRNRVRLDRVALLLANGRTSLPQAAVAAGFADCAQFHRVFRAFRWMAQLNRRMR